MRSPKRIKPFMKWLTTEWEKNPDLRFGQMLINEGIVMDDIRTWSMEISTYPLPHENMREVQTWGSRGKDVFIKDLDTDHIKAILETQNHIKDTSLERVLVKELNHRVKEE